jgi:hypothetical protein
VQPSEFARYYTDAQFAPVQTQLQTLVNAYAQGDGFNFSRGANQLRENLRALSPRFIRKIDDCGSNIFIIISRDFIARSGVTGLHL